MNMNTVLKMLPSDFLTVKTRDLLFVDDKDAVVL